MLVLAAEDINDFDARGIGARLGVLVPRPLTVLRERSFRVR